MMSPFNSKARSEISAILNSRNPQKLRCMRVNEMQKRLDKAQKCPGKKQESRSGYVAGAVIVVMLVAAAIATYWVQRP